MQEKETSGDRLKWDERYRFEECVLGTEPSRYLANNIDFIKSLVPGTRGLDIACGEGRNSIFLARQGFTMVGIDISGVGIEKAGKWMEREGLRIELRLADLEHYKFTDHFDLVINFNFLLRNLIPRAVAALSPGGVFVFDTLVDSPHVPTPHKKEFLLQPGEHLRIFQGFPGEIFLPEERLLDESPTAKLIYKAPGGAKCR
jgi:tellurite methyltransferase